MIAGRDPLHRRANQHDPDTSQPDECLEMTFVVLTLDRPGAEEIVKQGGGPARIIYDQGLIGEAGVALDRALFPLLVRIERLGPIGVVDLAARVGRDYTTVSRQVAKLQSIGLVKRQAGSADRRVHEAVVTREGKAMTD